MDDIKDKMNSIKEKVVGRTKETIGDLTDDEELKLKGRIQYMKSDVKENLSDKLEDLKEDANETFGEFSANIGNKFEDIKENVAGKINDIIDDYKKK